MTTTAEDDLQRAVQRKRQAAQEVDSLLAALRQAIATYSAACILAHDAAQGRDIAHMQRMLHQHVNEGEGDI